MKLRTTVLTVLLVPFAALAACSKSSDATTGADPFAGIPADARKEAETLWNTLCHTCHGMDGSGNGPAGAALNPKPRNHTDRNWQKSVTDEHIEKVILKGGAASGLSPLMPPNPSLEGKPDVVKALRAIVRSKAK
jgi:cytochrome c553